MKTLTLCVASKNPVKINAATKSLERAFPAAQWQIISIDAPSSVADQPMTCDATLAGAINRVKYCKTIQDADFYVSYEGGVDVIDGIPSTYAVVCVANKDRLQTGRSGTLPLPTKIYQQLQAGKELGDAMDELFDTQNIKQRGGAIGQLTLGLYTRESIYIAATILTLAPFVHANIY